MLPLCTIRMSQTAGAEFSRPCDASLQQPKLAEGVARRATSSMRLCGCMRSYLRIFLLKSSQLDLTVCAERKARLAREAAESAAPKE